MAQHISDYEYAWSQHSGWNDYPVVPPDLLRPYHPPGTSEADDGSDDSAEEDAEANEDGDGAEDEDAEDGDGEEEDEAEGDDQ